MDPQQRLLLETSWLAFKDAGFSKEALQDRNVGVFVGVSTPDYVEVAISGSRQDVYSANGRSNATAAGRLSFFFGTTASGTHQSTQN